MINEDLFQKMKKFEEELLKTDFSPRQKEILFQEKARMLINESKETNSGSQKAPNAQQIKEMPDSFSSMVNRAGISQHMDFVLFAVYHRIINLGNENVNIKDINEEYQLARMKSSNTSVFLINLVRRGSLMSQGKRDGLASFTITRDGVKYVEEKLKNGK